MAEVINPFEVGQWVQWSTHHQVKRGEVVVSRGPSIVLRWLDGEEQVFPVVEAYVGDRARGEGSMVVIEEPKEARRVAREAARGVTSITRAASILGTTPKRVRARLRSGDLRGQQRDGKWVSVDLDQQA